MRKSPDCSYRMKEQNSGIKIYSSDIEQNMKLRRVKFYINLFEIWYCKAENFILDFNFS